MPSNKPEILKLLLGKSTDLGSLSSDAKKLLDTLQKEFESDVFRHFFMEYNTLTNLGFTNADLKQYFDEWCTDAFSMINEAGIQQFINEKHTKLFGYSPGELI